MPSQAPFLILQTGEPAPSLRRYGSFSHWIRIAAGLGQDEVVVCRVLEGDALPRREGFAGVLISGSGAMVTERLDWSERSAAWLHDAAHAGMPLFGICYGHQLLAHALGGRVDWNPHGREIGTVQIDCCASAAEDPLFASMRPSFLAHATHMQSVLGLPSGACCLARSKLDDCHGFRWGEQVWGVQFHPEFGTRLMHGYIAARADKLRHEGIDQAAIARTVAAAPRARGLLRHFVRHARRVA